MSHDVKNTSLSPALTVLPSLTPFPNPAICKPTFSSPAITGISVFIASNTNTIWSAAFTMSPCFILNCQIVPDSDADTKYGVSSANLSVRLDLSE